MIGKRSSIIVLFLLIITTGFIIYQCKQLSFHLFSLKFTDHYGEDAPISVDLNNCILSFLFYHKLQHYLENSNYSYPIYLSFNSQPLPYDLLGKECASIFYKGQEQLLMKRYEDSCFYPFHISPTERQKIQTALEIIKTSFEKNNLELVLTGGSYIGSWRYHQIIPYDDDIDFYIRTEEKMVSRILLESLSKNRTNRFVFKDTENENQHWKLGILCDGIYKETCKVEIDFFFMWEDGESLRFLEWPNTFLKSNYYPLRQRPFENILFKAPSNFDTYMERQYKSNATQCYFKNHAVKNVCETKLINCDLLKYRYPYKIQGKYNNLKIELIIYKMNVQSLFIDTEYAT